MSYEHFFLHSHREREEEEINFEPNYTNGKKIS